jgi:hypothetical protein
MKLIFRLSILITVPIAFRFVKPDQVTLHHPSFFGVHTMMLRRILGAGIAGAALVLGTAVPAFASPVSSGPVHGNGISSLCYLGTYGDLTRLCDLNTLNDPEQYCDLGIYGDFTRTCDLANLGRPAEYLDLGTYGDYSGLLGVNHAG